MAFIVRSADDRRADIQARAENMQIDEDYISTLVDTFYGRVRQHPVLGPVFENAIEDDWEPHLLKMKAFWASVALNAGRYSGKPVPAHQKHASIKTEHFDIWLGLFEQTLIETARTAETVPYFMERAERIARSLRLALFPSLTPPRR